MQSIPNGRGKQLHITRVERSHFLKLGLNKTCLADRFFAPRQNDLFYFTLMKSGIKWTLFYIKKKKRENTFIKYNWIADKITTGLFYDVL